MVCDVLADLDLSSLEDEDSVCLTDAANEPEDEHRGKRPHGKHTHESLNIPDMPTRSGNTVSKNFELMQNIGIGLEKDPTPEIPRATTLTGRERGSKRLNTFQFDQHAHEECLQLVQRLFLLHAEPPHCVVFAGVEHGNGCSWICAQAAELLSENTPGTVCLVEANLRSPSLTQIFGVANHRGLTDCSAQRAVRLGFRQTDPPQQSVAALLWIFDP